ncbi:MAG TPA: ATP-dependent dethiobiotin synthetase BioD [Leptolyngbyaceae cyanobacterium M33_DOE_097]|uniref:ATP-dependent dethiobiotin synthetase BioD n=1 Tax=Oscillatoriales cyanobacterium SpSt-418 TaxID=2282169 RepID=A0A7C3PMB6_9CYAN|nr:ATP-dependent dethiobiotin synthetase BioD [Leptolyngbyaceae cyanobacterium M33_DOE_097]
MNLLITGTDTDAGKTVLTAALAAYWRKYCGDRRISILKIVQSGIGDGELYSQLFGVDIDVVAPLRFKAPIAPPLAASQEGKRVDLEVVWQHYEQLRTQSDMVLIEGVGGLGTPITYEATVADLAWDWHLPAVLVVPVKLGAVGQAVANVALAKQNRIHLKGIVLNCVQPVTETEIDNWTPVDLIQKLTGVPVLGIVPYLTNPKDLEELAQVASCLELERIFPNLLLARQPI